MAESSLRDRDFEDTIDIKRWETFIFGEKVSLWSIKVKGKFYFFGKEVAEALDYKNPREAVLDHVDREDRKTIEEVLGKNYKYILERKKSSGSKTLPVDFFQKIRSNLKLITEIGLISFCTESRMKRAKPFQKWVYKTIQEIRETGSYALPGGPIENPLDLIVEPPVLERRVVETCNKKTQTPRNSKTIKNYLKKLKNEFEKSLREISSDSDSESSRHYSSDSD